MINYQLSYSEFSKRTPPNLNDDEYYWCTASETQILLQPNGGYLKDQAAVQGFIKNYDSPIKLLIFRRFPDCWKLVGRIRKQRPYDLPDIIELK